MKRAVVAVGAAGAMLLLGRSALAQEDRQEVLTSKHRQYESPQHFAIELRISPFTPDIDSDPALGGQTPFGTVFGTSKRILLGLEFDWQAVRIPHLGTLGPGIGVSYVTMSANAQFQQPHGPSGTLTSGETTSLDIYPFYAVAVLRADAIWRELHVPLVPYGKLGLGYSIWRASNSLGTSHADGISGVGGSLGTQLGVGLSLDLNVFDEYSAKNFDESMGVNNTYLYAEYTRADLQGLGVQSDPLRVGAQSWTFGLAFEF